MSRRVGSPKALVTAATAAPNSSAVRSSLATLGIVPTSVVEIPGRPSMPNEAQVLEALRPVEDPEIHRSIVELNMVRGIEIDGGNVKVTVALTVAGCPMRTEIVKRVTDAVAPLEGVAKVDVDLGVMTDEERAALSQQLQGGTGTGA